VTLGRIQSDLRWG